MLETSQPTHPQKYAVNVIINAMSLAALQSGPRLPIRYGVQETPFGPWVIATTIHGICNLAFLDTSRQTAAQQYLQKEWPNAEIIHDSTKTQAVGDRLFTPCHACQSPLTLHLKGTDFQLQVWRSLLNIPFGQRTTYQELAIAMGKPTAARAIGNAIGRNPIAYLIPCHRVIRQSGALGGYRWGIERKAKLLEWEAHNQQTQ